MKLSNTTIISNDKDGKWVKQDIPNQETINHLLSFIETPEFDEVVDFYREYKGIESEGEDLFSKSYQQVWNEYKKFVPEVKFLASLFYQSTSTSECFSFYLLLRYNCYLEINNWQSQEIKFVRDFEYVDPKEEMTLNIPDENIGIIITKKVTKNKLNKWIEDNWDRIDNYMKYMPEQASSNLKEFELTQEIFSLYKKGNTPKQISDKLSNKYPEHPYIADEAWIANKIHRYKQRVEDQSKKLNLSPKFKEHFQELMFHITMSEIE